MNVASTILTLMANASPGVDELSGRGLGQCSDHRTIIPTRRRSLELEVGGMLANGSVGSCWDLLYRRSYAPSPNPPMSPDYGLRVPAWGGEGAEH